MICEICLTEVNSHSQENATSYFASAVDCKWTSNPKSTVIAVCSYHEWTVIRNNPVGVISKISEGRFNAIRLAEK